MENPNTWTPLHYAINEAYNYSAPNINHTKAIHSLISKANPKVTLEQVQSVIDDYQNGIAEGVIGNSLAAALINKLL